MFNTKVPEATIACEFGVEIKKLHLSMSGPKYNLGKKASHKRAPSGNQDKTRKTADKPPKQKAAKKENTEQQSRSDVHKIQEPENPHLIPVSWTLMMSYSMETIMMMIPYQIPSPPANSRGLKQKTQQSYHRRQTMIKVLKYLRCNMCQAISADHVLISTSIFII